MYHLGIYNAAAWCIFMCTYLVTHAGPTDSELYEAAMADGCIKMKTSDGVVLGVAGSGKTSSLTMAVDGKVPEKRVSTPCAKAPVRTVTHTRIGVMEHCTLTRMEDGEYLNVVSHTIMSEGMHCRRKSIPTLPSPPTEQPDTPTMQPDTSDFFRKVEDEIIHSSNSTTRPSNLLYDMRLSKLTDCGGQPQFLEVLPVFVHHMSLGIFAIKLNERLDHHPMIEYYGEDGELIGKPYRCPYSHEEVVKRCMRVFMSQGSASNQFKFLFIGTHRDLLKDCNGETLSEKNMKLRKIVRAFNMNDHVIYSTLACSDLIFSINAKDPSPQDWVVIEEVKKVIAESSNVPSIDIPLRWFAMELALLHYTKESNRAVLTEKECFDLLWHRGYSNKADVKAALKYLHQAKLIFYFEQRGLVVADMQMILDKLSQIVSYNIKLNTGSDDCDMQQLTDRNEQKMWSKFRRYGILNIKCLEKFPNRYVEGVFSAKELLELFTHLRVVSAMSADEFLMPSLLRMNEEACCNPEPETQTVPALAVEFPDSCPMLGLYCRLICYLINTAKWKVAEKDLEPYHLSRSSVHFSAPEHNPGRVTVNDPLSTFFVVTYHGPPAVASKLCPIILRTILTGLEKASEILHTPHNKETASAECLQTTRPQLSFLCFCESTPLHPATVSKDGYLKCRNDDSRYIEVMDSHMKWFSGGERVSYEVIMLW